MRISSLEAAISLDNIKRSINILGVIELITKLQKWNSPYKEKALFLLKMEYLKFKSAYFFCEMKLVA